MAATDSYRLAVKETAGRRATLPELEAIIPARALQELARIAGRRRRAPARRAGEPRRLRRRRHVADDAPHRRPVPELPPAAAGAVRARARAAARGGARGRAPRLADGAAQLAAAPALRRRRADGVARSRRTSARRASRCRRRTRATPMEIGFNAEFLRDGLESVDSDTVKFKLISPLRPAVLEGDARRLRVPDHADQARGLDRSLVVERVTLRNYRSYASLELDARAGHRARRRAERRRQDEPARVAARRDAGLLAAHAAGRAADPVRRDRRPRRRRRHARHVARSSSRVTLRQGQAKEARLNGARLPSAGVAAARGRDARLHARPARGRQGRAGCATRVLRPRARAAVPRPRRRAAGLPRRRSRSATPRCAACSSGSRRRDVARAVDGAHRRRSARRSSTQRRVDARRARAGVRRARGRARAAGRAARLRRASRRPRPQLEARLARDLERGTTGLGPHLDDVLDRERRPRPAPVRLAGRAAARGPVAAPRRGGAAADRRRCCCSTTCSRSSTSAAAACWPRASRAWGRR